MFTPHQISELLKTVPETHLDIIDMARKYAAPNGGIKAEAMSNDLDRLASALKEARNYVSDVGAIRNNIQLLLRDKI
jgi:hypothetical protein